MFDFHEKRKIRRIVYSKVFIAGIFLVTLFIGRSVFERFTIEREMAQKLEAKTAELQALQERAAVLESKVDHLHNERGIEEELRTRFDVAREGEQVVVIIDEEERESAPALLQVPVPENGSFSLMKLLKFW